MNNVIYIEAWIESKVNELAEIYRKARGTADCKVMESTLRSWGLKLAKYKQFKANQERNNENH